MLVDQLPASHESTAALDDCVHVVLRTDLPSLSVLRLQYSDYTVERHKINCAKKNFDVFQYSTTCPKKETLILSGDFRYRFSAENHCPFSFSFRFRP